MGGSRRMALRFRRRSPSTGDVLERVGHPRAGSAERQAKGRRLGRPPAESGARSAGTLLLQRHRVAISP